ncbi:MAG: S8 family peptidase [Bacteroidetes bacterium]|nr:S8 family peptidase [Bacteroidota bacterium]
MKFYFTFFIILAFLRINSQSVFNAELIKKIAYGHPSEKIDVLVLSKPNMTIDFSELPGIKFRYHAGNIYAISGDIQSIKALANLKSVVRIEYTQHHLQLMGDTCVVRNRIKDIKLGTYPLFQSYDGSGVIVGIIDSGTDFNHPDFKDVNGNSRIKYLWDMTKPLAANTPTPFGYGQEWTNSDIDMGLCTHTDLTHFGHGTNSSGIAAGNGLSLNKYQGMAPKADLVVVALDFNRPGFTISDALNYIITKSQLLNKPLVVNASVGDYYGSHDGTDLEAQIISNLIHNVPGRAMVASCGNGGSAKFHVGYDVVNADTSFTWISNNNAIISVTEYADTNQIKNVNYSVGVTNLNLIDLGATSYKPYNYALNTIKRDTIYNNSHRIGIVESIASINSFGVYELDLTFKADSIGYLWSISHAGTGRIDSWNFDYVSGTLPNIFEYPKISHYKMADTIQSIVSGFQCTNDIIAVGNYINRNQYIDVNNNIQINPEVAGQLHSSSSAGPTRDNRIKPDITASGATILAASPLAHILNLKMNAPYVVAKGGFHVTAGGTSASSPVVAGLAALYLQRHPTATNQQLKQAIIGCAYQDVFTGTALPNNKWGYGKLDGFATMTCGEALAGIKTVSRENGIMVYPNPFISEATISFSNAEPRKIKLYNSSGQLVLEDQCSSSEYILKRHNLASGLYLMLSEEKNITYRIKFVIL